MRSFIAYVDGFCEGNGFARAQAGGSFAVYDVTGLVPVPDHAALAGRPPLLHEARFALRPLPGGRATNNMAEMASLHRLLTELSCQGLLVPGCHTVVYLDSKLVYDQVLGFSRPRNAQLGQLHEGVKLILKRFTTRFPEAKLAETLTLVRIPGTVMKQTIIGH